MPSLWARKGGYASAHLVLPAIKRRTPACVIIEDIMNEEQRMELKQRFVLFRWNVTKFTVKQEAHGTWPTPLGRVWQFGHTRFLFTPRLG